MAQKKQTKKHKCGGTCCGNCYGPIYIQASNPSEKLLKWAEKQSEDGKIVYLQSGRPPGGGCVPGSGGCQ